MEYFLEKDNNKNLKSNLKNISFFDDNNNFIFKSDDGVFSKNKIHYSSLFLVKTFLKENKKQIKSILDMGCGYGFIGIVIGKILNIHVDMVDNNKRAVHLCELNIKNNKVDGNVWVSDIYEKIDNKYDLIITNPPVRKGKEIILNFLKGGLEKLNKNGQLWFVISKNQGAKSIKKELEKICNLEIIAKSKGFWVVLIKN